MGKYCLTVAGLFEEEVYRFNSSDPKKIIKKWFEQEIPTEDGKDKVSFKFVKWERIKKIEVVKEDFNL